MNLYPRIRQIDDLRVRDTRLLLRNPSHRNTTVPNWVFLRKIFEKLFQLKCDIDKSRNNRSGFQQSQCFSDHETKCDSDHETTFDSDHETLYNNALSDVSESTINDINDELDRFSAMPTRMHFKINVERNAELLEIDRILSLFADGIEEKLTLRLQLMFVKSDIGNECKIDEMSKDRYPNLIAMIGSQYTVALQRLVTRAMLRIPILTDLTIKLMLQLNDNPQNMFEYRWGHIDPFQFLAVPQSKPILNGGVQTINLYLDEYTVHMCLLQLNAKPNIEIPLLQILQLPMFQFLINQCKTVTELTIHFGCDDPNYTLQSLARMAQAQKPFKHYRVPQTMFNDSFVSVLYRFVEAFLTILSRRDCLPSLTNIAFYGAAMHCSDALTSLITQMIRNALPQTIKLDLHFSVISDTNVATIFDSIIESKARHNLEKIGLRSALICDGFTTKYESITAFQKSNQSATVINILKHIHATFQSCIGIKSLPKLPNLLQMCSNLDNIDLNCWIGGRTDDWKKCFDSLPYQRRLQSLNIANVNTETMIVLLPTIAQLLSIDIPNRKYDNAFMFSIHCLDLSKIRFLKTLAANDFNDNSLPNIESKADIDSDIVSINNSDKIALLTRDCKVFISQLLKSSMARREQCKAVYNTLRTDQYRCGSVPFPNDIWTVIINFLFNADTLFSTNNALFGYGGASIYLTGKCDIFDCIHKTLRAEYAKVKRGQLVSYFFVHYFGSNN